AADTVAPGGVAEVHHRVARPGSRSRNQVFFLHHADSHCANETVAAIALVEADFAADVRHADGVAVPTDAFDHAGEEIARFRVVELAEAQRVEARNGPRARREDIAHDAADAGRGALARLDLRGMVMRLHLEDD